ncbi:MAG: cyclic nucleotide-binding domain-containing protein [Cyclobacteriaceae bacterium]
MQHQELNQRLALLKNVIFFSHLEDDQLEGLANAMEPMELQPNDRLFTKGDVGNSMFIVESGSLNVHDGDYVFAKIEPPGIVGEYALLDQRTRSASITATTNTKLLCLSQYSFNRITSETPEVKDHIVTTLLLQLRQRNEWEEQLAAKNKQIQEQKDEIEKQRDLKNKFFSIISHDLRGPISSFQGITSILQHYLAKGDMDNVQGLMEEIDFTCNNLSQLLDNLLNWASTEQGQMPYNPEEIELDAIINELFDNFRATALAKRIKLASQPSTSSTLYVDRNSATTILRNLIHNSLKFTPTGGTIDISSTQEGTDIKIKLSDTGQGMDTETTRTLFEHEPKSTYGTQGEKGTGIGLQIVREFIRMNKGRIEVSSEVGQGSTFNVWLPASELAS